MRRTVLLAVLILSSAFGPRAQAQNTISTVAGGGTNAANATSAYLSGSFGIARDTTNHVTYLSVTALSIVYKVDSAGNITPYAGNGILGFSGDGGPATSAQLDSPNGIAVDGSGNLFIADSQNNRIRRVDFSTHVITTVAGSGNQYNGLGFFGGYSGDGGPATSALMNFPTAVAVDGGGNLFIADSNNNVIRKVDNSPTHIITTYAGNGTSGNAGSPNGDNGAATAAQLAFPDGVAVDSVGKLFIGDSGDSVVRMVDTSATPIITTYAGSAANIFTFSGDGGPANQAGLNNPQGVFVDSSDNLYIADTFNNRIRKVDNTLAHDISTVAGSAGICLVTTGCGDGAAPTSASLNSPTAVAVDGANGDILFCDAGTQRFRIVIPGTPAIINPYAGGGAGGDTKAATAAVIGGPAFVIVDGSGDLFILDAAASRIRKVDATTQVITNFAGNGVVGPPGGVNGDGGPAVQANLTQITHGIAFDPSGNLYFIDRSNFVIRRIDTLGTITRVAGNYGLRCTNAQIPAGCGDGGPALTARLRAPTGIAVDASGNVYIADGGLNRIRVICENSSCPISNPTAGDIYNFAGTGAAGATNGPAASATFRAPWGIAFDAHDNLYVADANNNLIRKIDNTASHNVTTYAFNGQPTFGGDGGPALSASMQFPQQVAVDSAGNVYVGGGFDNVVQRIDVNDQSVITVAGDVHNLDGGFRASDDGGPSTNALISNFGLAIFENTTTKANTLYIADTGNNRIRKVNLAPMAVVTSLLQPFGPVLPGGVGNTGFVTITNNGLDDLTVTNASVPAGFTLTNSCQNPATLLPIPVSPVAGLCLLSAAFTPPLGTPNGTPFSGNLTFNTNDPANPSFSFALSGTAVTTPETLTLNFTGGTGTISGSPEGLVNGVPTPIVCPNPANPASACQFSFALGQQVTLFAVGSAGSTLTGWTVNGGTLNTCIGATPCTVTMNVGQNVVANFIPSSVTVSGMGNGSGTIVSNPAGINCVVTNGVASGTCSFGFGTATQVTLTATAAAGGSKFAGWLGFCSLTGINTAGTGPCTLPLSIAGVTALNGALATAVFSGPAKTFTQGDVFVGTVDGMIFEYAPNGTLVQVLSSGNLGGTIAGMNFDTGGNLYAANPLAINTGNNPGTVEFFGNNGTGPTFDFGLYDSQPIGVVVVAPSGNVLVGQSAGQNTLLEFTNAVNGSLPTNTFFPAYDNGGIGYLELLDDGASVLYSTQSAGSSQTGTVKNFDIANNHQNPDFATGLTGGPAFAIRELPDKTVLVANTTQIVHLDQTGKTVLKTYKPGGGGLFYALNLNPDGFSFWTGDALSGTMYQILISDGTQVARFSTGLGFNSSALNFATIFGIAVLGQPQSGGADLAVNMTASPSPVAVSSTLTYAMTVTNNGPLNATSVTLSDVFPGSVKSFTVSQGTCAGSGVPNGVTCNLGTINSGSNATLTFVMATPAAPTTLLNTVNVTSAVPDPIPGNNSFTTATNVVNNPNPLSVEVISTNPLDVVTSNPSGINCSFPQVICTAIFSPSVSVTLTASGPGFAGWSVDGSLTTCPGTGPCTVAMIQQHTVIAGYNSPVAWLITALPGGVVNVPYNVDLSQGVLGGTQSYTFSLTTGPLPGGLTLTGSTISGVPNAVGPFPITLKVTDSSVPPGTATLSTAIPIITPLNTQAALVNGPYAVLFRGVSDADASLRDFVGSLNFNGSGTVAGTIDTNGNGTSPAAQTLTVTGTYTIGPDNRGLLFLNTPTGKFGTFAFSVGDIYKGIVRTIRFIRFDDNTGTGTRGAGIMRRQMPSTFTPNSFAGTYVFAGTGQDPTSGRATEIGLFTVDNAQAFGSGSADLNDNGILQSIPSISGSYSTIDSATGRTQWTLNNGATAAASYIIDPNNVVFMTLDPGASNIVIAGTAERQANPGSFSNSSLAGPDIISEEGPSGAFNSSNSQVFLGIAMTSVVGGVPTVTFNFDSNNDQKVVIEGTESAPYTIAANGRGTFNFTSGVINSQVILYLVRPDHGFAMDTGTDPGFAEIDLQHGGPFSNSIFAGNYFVGSREPATPSGGSVLSGVGLVSGNTFSFNSDESHERGTLSYDNTGSFGMSVAPNGRATFTPSGTGFNNNGNAVGYAVSPSRVFLADIDPNSHHPSIIESQTITMPPGVPSPTTITAPFGTTSVGTPLQQTFNVSNDGDGLMTVTSVINATDFFTSGACVATLPSVVVIPHGGCQLIINFDPASTTQTGVLLHETLTLQTDAGSVTINASGTVTAATLQSIAVTPANPSIAKGRTQQFTATGTFSDNSTQNLTAQVTWASATPAVATITAGGLATGVGTGTSNISATLTGISGSTVLTVTAAVLQSIAVTPANPSIAKGLTQQFTATGTFSDNSTQNLTSQVTWASATPVVATINAAGLATAVGTGTSTISATLTGITGSTVLTVTSVGGPTLVSIAVTPANPTIPLGATQQFIATGTFSDNSTQIITTSVTWGSATPAVATINNTAPNQGLATSVGAGTSNITATSGNIVGSTVLTVAVPVIAADWNVSGEGSDDKQRIDGKSSPLKVGLTNTSATQTVHIKGASADNLAYTVTTDCTTLGPGQSCSVFASLKATQLCEIQAANITVADDDPGGNFILSVNGFGADTGLMVNDLTNTNLLTNGSFESPVVSTGGFSNFASGSTGITGWKVVGAGGGVSVVSGTFSQSGISFPAQDGSQWVDLTGVGTNGTEGVEQTVATTSGTQYTMSFWVGNVNNPGGIFGTSSTVKVFLGGINGTLLGTFTNSNTTTGIQTWQQFSTTFTATGPTTTIDFINADPSSDNTNGLDNVVVTAGAQSSALSAQQLAQSLVGPGVTISNVKYTGALRAAGNFTGDPKIIGFGSGVVLGSGSVRNVVGPNCSTQISVDNGRPGDSDLDSLLTSGQTTNDAAVLEFDFVPTSPSVSFQYVFSSDEYNEFVGQFNDVFAFFLNGNNIALLPTNPPVPVSINNVNANTNPTFFINNDLQFPNAAPVDTEMDGLTVVLTAQGQVTPNKTNHIKLAIADALDFALDSNVFIKAGSLTSTAVTLTPPTLGFGNQQVGTQSNPQPVTLANAGTTAVNISSIAASAGFGETDNCPKQLAPAGQAGSSCTLNITFDPTSNVVFNGTVTVTDDSPVAGSQQVVTLTGTGTGTGPTLQSITVAPPTPSIVAGTTQAFTATGHFSDGSTGAVTVSWSSGNTAIATITATTGVASGITAGGPITITATSTQTPGITGTAQLTVTAAPVLISIAVTPVNPTVVVGQNQQFTATGTFSDNSKQDLTASVVWASSNTEAATITAGGLATGLTGGTNTTITATKAQGNTNIVGTTTLTVTTVPFILTITPPPGGNPGAPPTISPGGTLAIGLTLTAAPGFNGTVSFGCVSNQPQFLTCTPAPSSVTLSGNTPKQVAIVMNTFCQGETPMYGPGPGGFGGGLALLLAAAMLGSITWAYRTRSRWALSFAVLLLMALGSAACSSPSSGPAGRTPAGTYVLSITATAGGASQTVQQTIQVTP